MSTLHEDNRLSAQELRIVNMLHEGRTNADISRRLGGISVETVKKHVSNIFNKLGCSSRLEAVVMTMVEHAPELVSLREQVVRLEAEKTASEARLKAERDSVEADLRKELEITNRLLAKVVRPIRPRLKRP